MKLAHLAPRSPFGKTVMSLALALPAVAPFMYARAGDAPIDYTSFRSADEVRAAALRRVAQTIEASTKPVDAEPPRASGPLVQEQQAPSTSQLIEPVFAPVTESAPPQLESASAAPSQPVPEKVAAEAASEPFVPGLLAVADQSLDEIRGGFEIPGANLKYSFGIERAVFINGELVAHTVLRLQNLGAVSARGGVPLQASVATTGAAGAFGVIQNGPGNNFTAQVGADMLGTVIQNTLNDQKIQNITTINASVNSMQVMRAMSVQSAVQNGIIGSLRR